PPALFPYTTLFRSEVIGQRDDVGLDFGPHRQIDAFLELLVVELALAVGLPEYFGNRVSVDVSKADVLLSGVLFPEAPCWILRILHSHFSPPNADESTITGNRASFIMRHHVVARYL